MSENINKYMPLGEDEKILEAMEGNAYNFGSNIFAKIFGLIDRIVSFLIGSTRKVELVVTDKRIIVIEITKMLWFIDAVVTSRSVAKRSVQGVGYRFARSLFVLKNHYLDLSAESEKYVIKSRVGQHEVLKMIATINRLTA